MALISCPNCGKQISDRANFCVHCGIETHVKDVQSKFETADNILKETNSRSDQEKNTLFSKILDSAWIVLSVFGGAWIGFLLIGSRCNNREWKKIGIIYAVLLWGFFLGFWILPVTTDICMYSLVGWFLTIIISIVHSIVVNKEYLELDAQNRTTEYHTSCNDNCSIDSTMKNNSDEFININDENKTEDSSNYKTGNGDENYNMIPETVIKKDLTENTDEDSMNEFEPDFDENSNDSISEVNDLLASTTKFDLLKKYKELLDEGIINQEEFEIKKKELLDTPDINITVETSNKTHKSIVSDIKKKIDLKHSKRIAVVAIAAILVLLVILLIPTGVEKDQQALKQCLLNPSSLIVYESYVNDDYSDGKRATMFYFGAENKGGGVSDDWALVYDGEVQFYSECEEAEENGDTEEYLSYGDLIIAKVAVETGNPDWKKVNP